ncbi:MAG: hypothetical protein E7L17_14595 [Clostridium sp.]|uniref:hypothetical protein n=1 Tax=Clostridium sp. TaxID=1506 RepID=UPI0029109AA5|nr:hypothetical protein [Clostridium sp.]MDU7339329.1 hypothetical protein [Clostridium sp.]
MNIGDEIQVNLESGLKRTGIVCYIHPGRRYYTLRIKGKDEYYKESFLMGRGEEKPKKRTGQNQVRFTPEQDAQILKTKSIAKLAKKMGKSREALDQRKRRLLKERVA